MACASIHTASRRLQRKAAADKATAASPPARVGPCCSWTEALQFELAIALGAHSCYLGHMLEMYNQQLVEQVGAEMRRALSLFTKDPANVASPAECAVADFGHL
eukprot:TRINITY_DN46985_c0_g1_i1.p4 TRINITY_DN46985_c0_g1~~TRINITY_DN46985_c0_g1_i1.p4  ORF type:complete len:104 (+),score=13.69 TRINITY_DN46985_c0_g1_i1:14-325(+)